MSRASRAETKVAIMIGVMIIAFLVAWTPYAVLALIIAFGDPNIVTPGIAVIPALMAKSSICYNPVIYAGLNTQFQSSWSKNKKRCRSESRGGEVGELTTVTSPTRYLTQNLSSVCKKATKVTTHGKTQWRTTLLMKKLPTIDVEPDYVSEPCSEVLQVTFAVEDRSEA